MLHKYFYQVWFASSALIIILVLITSTIKDDVTAGGMTVWAVFPSVLWWLYLALWKHANNN